MNMDQIKGDWRQVKGKIKQKWAKLTDDDLTLVEGRAEELAGVLQKRYGIAKEEAERQCSEFYSSCGC